GGPADGHLVGLDQNAEAGVGHGAVARSPQADVVAEDRGGAADHLDAVARVARDEVALPRAADGGIAAALYLHAVTVVGNGEGPQGVHADDVAGQLGVGGVGDVHTGAVAGDDVVEDGGIAAALYLHAVKVVGNGEGPPGVRADAVVRHLGFA